MCPSFVLLAMLGVAAGSNETLAPWGTNSHPTDAPKGHVEKIAARRHVYVVRQGGTMDGGNCRSPIGVGMMDGPPIEQTWESNRAVRLEKTRATDVINPWLANGRNSFRTLDEIVASAVKPGMTDRDKAHAIWFQEIRHRYHWAGDNNELGDPVKVFNIYGHNTCGNDSICLAGLWKRAGLKVTPAHVVGHCVTQAFFDGRWNLFDGDMHSMYLLRDNKTVACEQDLVRDHDLIRRSHTQGILNPDRRANDEWEASIFMFEGTPTGDRNCVQDTSMNMVLRPGEAITWRWGHISPVKYHGEKPRYPNTICNGLWEYRPDFSRDLWKKGAASALGIKTNATEVIAEAGKTGTIIWSIRSPYVLVGGRLEIEGSGAKFSLSWDGKTWLEAGSDLDKFFSPAGPARYEYRLRCELDAGARLKRLGIVNDIQMTPLALPAMAVGDNQFIYTDQSPGEREVRITHDWVERSASRPLVAPATPVFPPDKGEAEGSHLVFRWPHFSPRPSDEKRGDGIADYHFELSDRQDMSWPLSPNFYKLISKTVDRGKPQYTLPHGGLLAVDRKYYWRVRAKNDKGVWSPWSETWSFTLRGPASPTDVTLAVDRDRGAGVLRWKPNPIGRKPAKYRIYGSDEKGFTIGDEPYHAVVGVSKIVSANWPANFVTEVSATETAVIGAEINLPNANRAYYRVVAVDEKGNRSGPSDFAEGPRPVLWSRPVTAAKVGSEYRYALAAVRSLGDLRTRVVDGKETMNYWDIEIPRFALQQGPAWLKIDERTGVIAGVPESPGKVVVTVTATIDREIRKLDERALSWGHEKTLSTSTQRVGAATQTFTVEIAIEKDPPKNFTNGTGMKFVWIPPGSFLMGSPKDEEGREPSRLDEMQHKVTLTKGFYMGVYTVTQEQWKEIMGNNPSLFKGAKKLPVEDVSWNDCQTFIKKLRQKDMKPYRLPTEAEWEYACRAATKTPFYSGATISTDQANYNGEAYSTGKKGKNREKTTPVGSFPANAWDLHDMHGNVWQWCQDWYGDYPQKELVDPQGMDTGTRRVLRGGSWINDPQDCRSACRLSGQPDRRYLLFSCGLRLCCDRD